MKTLLRVLVSLLCGLLLVMFNAAVHHNIGALIGCAVWFVVIAFVYAACACVRVGARG